MRPWGVLAAVSFANFLVALLHLGMAASGPLLRRELGLDPRELGLLLAAPPFGLMLGVFAWGVLVDRYEDRLVLAAAFVLTAAAIAGAAIAAAAGSVPWLLVALFLSGLCGSAAHPAGGRAVTQVFDAGRHGTVLAIRHTAVPLGGVAGGLLLPLGIDTIGIGATLGGVAAACLVSVAWTLHALPREDAHVLRAAVRSLEDPLRSAALWLLALGSGSLAFVQLGIASFLTIYLVDEAGFGVGAAAGVFAASQLLGAGGRVGLGVTSDRVRVRVLRAVAAAAAVGIVALLLLGNGVAGGVILAATLVLATSWNGVSVAAAAALSPEGRTGATLGMQTTVNSVACTIGPIIIGVCVAGPGWHAVFAVFASALLLSILSFTVLDRLPGRMHT
ncbi:MAG: transporter [Thermoleophilia bacterium]|nr:transporter [Thermoleophilia bacterium]